MDGDKGGEVGEEEGEGGEQQQPIGAGNWVVVTTVGNSLGNWVVVTTGGNSLESGSSSLETTLPKSSLAFQPESSQLVRFFLSTALPRRTGGAHQVQLSMNMSVQ